MSYQSVYGYPCVTDPNDFSPDYESCSPQEIATHKRACETFGTPDYQPNKGSFSQHDAEGRLVLHVTRTSWGIGVNSIRCCDGCSEPADGLLTCHDCGGHLDFCAICWPSHAKDCEL